MIIYAVPVVRASPSNLISALDYEDSQVVSSIQNVDFRFDMGSEDEEKEACPIPELPQSDLESCKNNQLPESFEAKCWMKCYKEASSYRTDGVESSDPYCTSERPSSDECELAYWNIRCKSKELFVAIYDICLHIFD